LELWDWFGLSLIKKKIGNGSTFQSYEKIQIEGKSEVEIQKILEDLRKKARVPDFQ
jgi:hypothetical protein